MQNTDANPWLSAASPYQRIAALYLPLAAAVFAGLLRPRPRRLFPAVLLGTLWALTTLVILQRINLAAHLWSFWPASPAILGMPLELYFGWAIFWGAVPILIFRKSGVTEIIILFASLDLWLMPMAGIGTGVRLFQYWLLGEVAALILVLAPAYNLARWTLDNTHLNLRAAMQVTLSGMLFLFMLPEIAFALQPAPHAGSVWQPLLALPHPLLILAAQIIAMAALPGINAVQEFAKRGSGTPIPYDPPQRLVTSGIYRYCANPMQLSCSVVMFLWALILRNPWLIGAAAISTIYSAGIAHWDEGRDLALRFGPAWQQYRSAVPAWRLRWHPFVAAQQPARLYISATCGQCSVLRQWIEAQHPLGLQLIDAETLPQGSIRRLRYDPADETPPEEGLLAFARTLEHINLFRTWCAMILRLPILHQLIQAALDLSGFGPMTIPSSCPANPGPKPGPTERHSNPTSAA